MTKNAQIGGVRARHWKQKNAVSKSLGSFATTWMELEGLMLSEISQSEKDSYHMISLILGI